MRFLVGVLFTVLAVQPAAGEVRYQTVVRTVPAVQDAGPEPTPILDSLVDWDEVDRQNDCLWVFLQQSGVELTLQSVLAAGEWTDALGGACAAIGED